MAEIVITRADEFINKIRNVHIFLDGKKIGSIGNGVTRTFTIKPGNHELIAKIDWCGSKAYEFSISEDGVETIKLSGIRYGNFMVYYAWAIIALHFLLYLTLKVDTLFWFALPPFMILLYYVTLGKNRYLKLRPVTM